MAYQHPRSASWTPETSRLYRAEAQRQRAAYERMAADVPFFARKEKPAHDGRDVIERFARKPAARPGVIRSSGRPR